MYDQDTSLADGFIGKLAKADESKYKKAGIISPEEVGSWCARPVFGLFCRSL
jgi:hypothetical protein